jgi:hypothetical protein
MHNSANSLHAGQKATSLTTYMAISMRVELRGVLPMLSAT